MRRRSSRYCWPPQQNEKLSIENTIVQNQLWDWYMYVKRDFTIKSTCKRFEKIHSDLVDHIANAPYMGEYLPLTLYLLLSDSNQTDVPWQLKDSTCKQSRLLRSGIFTAIWQGTVSRGKSHKRKTSWTRSFKNVCMKGLLKFEYEWFSV